MSKKLTIYYLVLLAAIGFKLVGTIYQGSLLVFHSRNSHKLTAQKAQLQNQKIVLNLQLAQQQSLTKIADSLQLDSYQIVSSPILVDASTTVAANSL